ncbi:MAG: MauE/DoxX family redox-associated membrane protein, partial [Acidimicrobiia bacterium]
MADHGAMSAAVQRLSPARILLAVVLVAMAAGQVSNVGGFARILDTYRLFPEDVPTVGAWAFLAAETTAGVAVLRRVRWGATLATVVAVAWTVLATQAFARGLP